MTRADAAKLVAIVVTAYPNYDKFRDPKAVEATVNLWALMFESDPGAIVGLAVKKHRATSKWPPSVAEIRELMLEAQRPDLIPPDQAWAAVSDLMYQVGEHNHGDLHQQLPPLIARAVETIGYTALYEMHRAAYIGGKAGMDRVAFMQQYTPMYEREKSNAMTPKAIGEGIGTALAALPDGGQKLIADREAGRRAKDEEYRRMAELSRERMRLTEERLEQERQEKHEEWLRKREEAGDLDEFRADPVAFTLRQLEERTKGATT